jgi:hypothetical protein
MGLTYQTVSRERDVRRFQAPGELVDVGGFHLHSNEMDQPTDRPMVILEHGGGGLPPQWDWE